MIAELFAAVIQDLLNDFLVVTVKIVSCRCVGKINQMLCCLYGKKCFLAVVVGGL